MLRTTQRCAAECRPSEQLVIVPIQVEPLQVRYQVRNGIRTGEVQPLQVRYQVRGETLPVTGGTFTGKVPGEKWNPYR